MRIESEKITKNMDKITEEEPSFAFSVLSEGPLLLKNRERSLTAGNYILYVNDALYIHNGLHKFSSVDIPESGINIGVKSSSKLLVFHQDNSAEYITAKKEASESFKFLLFVILPACVEFSFVDSSISPKFFSYKMSKTESNIEYCEVLARIILGRYSAELEKTYTKFIQESNEI